MIIEIDKRRVDVNLVIFDSVSLQAWSKEDGKLAINIIANDIKRIIVETNE